jgi:toxin ParE1/3/4
MSHPSRALSLTPRAEQDYDDILLYGRQTWGMEQTLRYKSDLDRAIERLGEFPEISRTHDRYFEGCRIRSVGSHVLYYRILDDEIQVVRILHKRADPSRKVFL